MGKEMEVLFSQELVSHSDLKVGGIAIFEGGLILKIEDEPDGASIVGFLKGGEDGGFCWRRLSNQQECNSLGTDWLLTIEPACDEKNKQSDNREYADGTPFYLGREGFFARFQKGRQQQGGSGPCDFDLKNNKKAKQAFSGNPVYDAAIWLSREHYESPHSKPLVKYCSSS
ncbi:hypothetical protein JYP46_04675 [Nitratireductor aquimarinus]|uniref:hypothetical protein n=1 Tax=Alphaproteobacteria TaxID=28211 RepID=UPI0019D39815|nr:MULTISPECIES: hypothetical protein [Alphaproteobacteria]MBN7756108.1 hypothetical protein [Nitratireductor aquimarinus]MBY5998866.1 hypothetical protein [Tritonibacter mobilis]MBY6020894.1 hypothetical protein [Nitratireductor sp. DP7N14-4]